MSELSQGLTEEEQMELATALGDLVQTRGWQELVELLERFRVRLGLTALEIDPDQLRFYQGYAKGLAAITGIPGDIMLQAEAFARKDEKKGKVRRFRGAVRDASVESF